MANLKRATKADLIKLIEVNEETIAKLQKDVEDAKQSVSNKAKKEIAHKEELIVSLKNDLANVRDSNNTYAANAKMYESQMAKFKAELSAKNKSIDSMSKTINKQTVELDNANNLIQEYSKAYDKHVVNNLKWFVIGVVLTAIVWFVTTI